jgi:hypothetical protein
MKAALVAIGLIAGALIVSATLVATADTAQALPIFARQTGQPCGNCHTDFLGLTPFGRRFKLGGYTLGGGPFRTPLFSEPKGGKIFPTVNDFQSVLVPRAANANASAESALHSYAAESVPGSRQSINDSFAAVKQSSDADKGWVPPIAVMLISGYTHTEAPDPRNEGSRWRQNDNVGLAQASLFGGGAITDNIGVFAQLTYAGAAIGDLNGTWGWDNIDVRFANTGQIGGVDVLYGITAHNNPTVQDVWNTAPAWSFPYFATQLGFGGPSAATLVDGLFGQRVAGLGGYLFVNDMLYLEATGYQTLGYTATQRLGADPISSLGQFDGVAPYLRVALEKRFGDHNLMVGAFAMQADVRPWTDPTGATTPDLLSQTNRYTDIGVDTQYQYRGDDFWFILRGSYIHERQRYGDTGLGFIVSQSADGNVAPVNATNTLNTLKLGATFAYGGDNRVVLTGQYFNTWGTSDANLYQFNLGNGISPNTNGVLAEIAYIPFGTSRARYWPWFNTRIGLQYYYYNKFDGDSISAHDKNTVMLYSTILF